MVELLNPQKKNPSIGIFIVTLILAVLAGLFLALPKYNEYKSDSEAEASAADSYQTIEQQESAVKGTLAKITSNQADLNKLDMAIPDQAGVPDLYALVEQQAKSAGLTITSMQASDEADKKNTPGQPATTVGVSGGQDTGAGATGTGSGSDTVASTPSPSPSLGIVDLNLTVSGDLNSYSAFLKNLQSSLRLIDVQSIDVSADSDKGVITFRTTLKTYYEKQK